MSTKVILRPAGSSIRRQALLQSKSSAKASTHLGEAVGGTAAVCCCCPFALANVVYLTIYKVPATICQRVLKKSKQRRHRRVKSAGDVMYPAKRRCTCGCCDEVGVLVHPTCSDDEMDLDGGVKSESVGVEEDKDVMELEKEMWETFYGTGFWRSSSQRNKDSSSSFSSSSSPRMLSVNFSPQNFQVLTVPLPAL
ncbi:hypothetical protein L195_g045812 [Trifolium pratense]|uniref:Uncharacterized protein n=1 Tax=Trifolium pratense TaxID=57577 RepID=A0A2K3MFX6_TRIPR|nr:uncharacterized protein LOC123902834 [Trifolium pratense]PNX89690.1 hypothetical protein L195_g045812 [Trifolium pratense]